MKNVLISGISLTFIFGSSVAFAADCAQGLKVEKGAIGRIIQCLKVLENENDALRKQIAVFEGANDEKAFHAKLPSGAVIAFAGTEAQPCPSRGWELFEKAKGRFIVGAGHGLRSKLTPHQSGDIGGEEKVILTVSEMPEHNHFVSSGYGPNWHDGLAGSAAPEGIDRKFNDPNPKIRRDGGHGIHKELIGNTGGNKAHNNMPPFLALYYCMKK